MTATTLCLIGLIVGLVLGCWLQLVGTRNPHEKAAKRPHTYSRSDGRWWAE